MANDALTRGMLADILDTIRPPLYYATNATVERGQILLSKKPEFIVCHPDDLNDLREQNLHRRFVHLRDRPIDSEYPLSLRPRAKRYQRIY